MNIYEYMYICVYIIIFTNSYKYVMSRYVICMFISDYMCLYVFICVYMCLYMFICVYMCLCICKTL